MGIESFDCLRRPSRFCTFFPHLDTDEINGCSKVKNGSNTLNHALRPLGAKHCPFWYWVHYVYFCRRTLLH